LAAVRSFGLYALGNAWLLGLIALLVLFYFLKLKRPRLEIPSLFLWRQVLSDKRVNSPFQRFKRNILLLLQLLLLLLLILAALQPFWRGETARAERIPILIDSSASMAGLEGPGGRSRLGVAREKVEDMVDGLLPDQRLCLISFSRTARRRTDFTNDKRALRAALQEMSVEDVPGNVEEALRLAQGLAQTVPFDEVMLLSDGNFPARAYFDLSFAVDYQKLPPAGRNLGLTSLSARRTAQGDWDVFVLIEGSPDAGGPATVELIEQGQVIASEEVSVIEGKAERVAFRVDGGTPVLLEVGLGPEDFDSLASDNVAFLELPATRALDVYVPKGMAGYARALAGVGGMNLYDESDPARPARAYDLMITDRQEDLVDLEGAVCCYVNLLPEDLAGLVSVEPAESTVVDWDRTSSLLQHVELGDLVILERPTAREGVRQGDYDDLGYEVLVHGDRGPLLVQKRQGERLLFYVLFHTDRSTLPYRVGFPVLISNLVQLAARQAGQAEINGRRTGVLQALPVRPGRTYEVRGPDGLSRRRDSDQEGLLSGVPAPVVGSYSVHDGGRLVTRVGASLLAAQETMLQGAERIEFEEDLSVAAASTGRKMDRALWPILVMLAFCVLMGEWWYFQRKPGGYPQ